MVDQSKESVGGTELPSMAGQCCASHGRPLWSVATAKSVAWPNGRKGPLVTAKHPSILIRCCRAANDWIEPFSDIRSECSISRDGRKAVVRCKCERSSLLFSERTFGAVRQRCVEAWPVGTGSRSSLRVRRRRTDSQNRTYAQRLRADHVMRKAGRRETFVRTPLQA